MRCWACGSSARSATSILSTNGHSKISSSSKPFFQPLDYGVAPASNQEAKQLREEVGIDKKNGMNRKKLQEELVDRIDHNKPVPFEELFVAQPRRNMQQQGQQRSVAELQSLLATIKDPERKKQLEQRIKQLEKQQQKKGAAGTVAAVTPKLLGAEEVSLNDSPDPRYKLMEWLRRKDNPYFARAWVNRVWASYFGVGIVEPPDDNSMANPPSNKPLLDYLAQGFIANNYDMRWLNRTILNSATYQRSWKTNETNQLDSRNFSHALIRRMPAEVAYDALAEATADNADAEAMRWKIDTRAIGPSSDKLDALYACRLRQAGADRNLRLRAIERSYARANRVYAQRRPTS